MYYSITFGETGNTRNTWSDWHLMPESPPVVPNPKPKTTYIDIPGRIQGPIDMSRIPFGRQLYDRIIGSWVFVMQDDYWHDANRIATHDAVRSWLHGRVTRMTLEEDPNHYFQGRFAVEAPKSSQGPYVILISFELEPVRYNLDGTIDQSWVNNYANQ